MPNDQLGLLRQPSGTEPAAEHRRRIDTNEATLASQLLRLKDGMAAEASEAGRATHTRPHCRRRRTGHFDREAPP